MDSTNPFLLGRFTIERAPGAEVRTHTVPASAVRTVARSASQQAAFLQLLGRQCLHGRWSEPPGVRVVLQGPRLTRGLLVFIQPSFEHGSFRYGPLW